MFYQFRKDHPDFTVYQSCFYPGKLFNGRESPMVHFKYMMEASKKVVEDRQANPIYFSEDHDLLGLMLDHTVDDKTHGKINESKDSFKGNFKKMITAKEVGQSSQCDYFASISDCLVYD